MLYIAWLIALLFTWKSALVHSLPPCDSDVYCYGPILKTIQNARLFSDSKTFVDMNIKTGHQTIKDDFAKLIKNYNGSVTKDALKEFVHRNFEGPGQEFESWTPSDLPRIPKFLNDIQDLELYDFGWDLCRIWKDLGRKIKLDVKLNPDKYSLVYLPEPFVVPGGRFRETYYWDSYWVIKGLLACEMTDTVRGMLLNFAHLVDTYGFIPNGGRIYYTERSQPPFFIPMVYEYFQETKNMTFLQEMIDVMEKEHEFWVKSRTTDVTKDGQTFKLSRYASLISLPRPESYTEDETTAFQIAEEDREELYSNLASAAESGWDFSSRWFSRDLGQSLSLKTTKTKDIIPVDLNSILCYNEDILAISNGLLGNVTRENFYRKLHLNRKEAIQNILWDNSTGSWFDYSISGEKSRKYFYQSNIFPLFFNCTDDTKEKEERIFEYIKREKVILNGGVPTSMENTGQQWDSPNLWPPLQHVWVEALKRSSNPKLQVMADDLLEKWVHSNWLGWNRTRNMFEKYSAEEIGTRGGGGEYDVQEGFGWTNGVLLDFLKNYGSSLQILNPDDMVCNKNAEQCHAHCATDSSISLIPQTRVINASVIVYTITLLVMSQDS